MRIAYGLASWPFFAFELAFVGSTLHGYDATAYDQTGLLVPKLKKLEVAERYRHDVAARVIERYWHSEGRVRLRRWHQRNLVNLLTEFYMLTANDGPTDMKVRVVHGDVEGVRKCLDAGFCVDSEIEIRHEGRSTMAIAIPSQIRLGRCLLTTAGVGKDFISSKLRTRNP